MSGHEVANVSTDTVTDENSNRGIVRVIMLSCHGESGLYLQLAMLEGSSAITMLQYCNNYNKLN